MLNFDPPRIRRSLGQAALREPYPSWLLDVDGVVQSANLMAFWLWDRLGQTEAIQPDLLIGRNIFDVQAANFERIPLFHNIEFYAKWSALVKSAATNQISAPYTSLIAKMKADPHRARVYEDVVSNPEHVWEYHLLITIPESAEPLELSVTTYRLEGGAGFLTLTSPIVAVLPTIEAQYNRLITQYGEKAYILSEKQEKPETGSGSFFSNFPSYYRIYYPTMIHDPLWYIIDENKAQQALFGISSVGMHFFELFFAPQLRPWMGPLQETSGPRAMKYFETFTMPFRREGHELHTAYTQVLQRLLQIPEYRTLTELAWKATIHLNLPADKEAPFYSCRVFLPWGLAPEITLQFRSMVRFLYRGLLVVTDQHYYEEALIPENYETEVALLLLYLSSHSDENMRAVFKQMLWGLALLKTLQEGLENLEDGDAHWNPEDAFNSNYQDAESEMLLESEEREEALISAWRKHLDDCGRLIDVEILLTYMKALATNKAFEHFSAFLEQELERIQRGKVASQPGL